MFQLADLPPDVGKMACENINRVVANSDCKKLCAPKEQACSLVWPQTLRISSLRYLLIAAAGGLHTNVGHCASLPEASALQNQP